MKKEIGSFIELDFKKNSDYHSFTNLIEQKSNDVLKLNTARAGIYHACKVLEVKKIYVPYYICPSVPNFLKKKNVEFEFYNLTPELTPTIKNTSKECAILIVNYFGLFSDKKLKELSIDNCNVIIDNSQAFFAKPLSEAFNVYSPRKFFGVPDGCYVYGKNANSKNDYLQDNSSDTSSFLLKRHEFGCNAVYAERMINEKRLDDSDILLMSELSNLILGNVDYENTRLKRISNFIYLNFKLAKYNQLDVFLNFDASCTPMVFPFVSQNEELLEILKENTVFTGRWWNNVLKTVEDGSVESNMSKFMLPIPIDQRYTIDDMENISKIIIENL